MPTPFEFIPRGYLHFDSPVGMKVAERLATDPVLVARHAFYPFITYEITTQKIRKRRGGGVEFKEPKIRSIAYAAHMDSHVFSHYAAILGASYELALRLLGIVQCVTAFRSLNHRRNIHFANEAFDFILANVGCAVLAMDVSGFFDNLDHGFLKRFWCQLLNVIRLPADHFAVFEAITKFCAVDRDRLYEVLHLNPARPRADGRHRVCSPSQFRNIVRGNGLCRTNHTGRGIPQGSPISAVLSNVYMLEFDSAVNAFVSAHGGLYRRYCDDILVVLPTVELRQEAAALIRSLLLGLRLPVQEEKTDLIDFVHREGQLFASRPLQYLGFTFDGRRKRIRPASIARYYKKVRAGVLRAKMIRRGADARAHLLQTSPLRRRKLHVLYSYLGRHNFLSYAFEAARIMNDPGIKDQIKGALGPTPGGNGEAVEVVN